MSNSHFSFKQFTINQELCAMKVGTDATLLGAWANIPDSAKEPDILDVGTGTGIVALMMAQRFPQAHVSAIDIDEGAVNQARLNAEASPFSSQIEVSLCSLQDMPLQPLFDAIVSNPPFFTDSLQCPDQQRTVARHATTLTYSELMRHAYHLLKPSGELSLVIPFDYKERLNTEAFLMGLFLKRECAVKTTPRKPAKRYLLSYQKSPSAIQRQELVIGDVEYMRLTSPFYLSK